jgi:hypothetical protein
VIIEDRLELVGDFGLGNCDNCDVTDPGVIVDWLGRGDDVTRGADEELLRRFVSLEKTLMLDFDCLDGREEAQEWTTGAEPPTTIVPEADALGDWGLPCEITTPPTAPGSAEGG